MNKFINNKIKKFRNKCVFEYEKSYYKSLAKKGISGPSCMLMSSDINVDGYIVKEDTGFVRSIDSIFAVVSVAKFNTLFGEYIVPYIGTDNFFNELSESTKSFIIEHELIHFYEQRDTLLASENGYRNISLEFDADLGAAKKVGFDVAINALNEMKEVAVGIIDLKEINIRIKMLKENRINYCTAC